MNSAKKKIFYEKATLDLLNQINSFGLTGKQKHDAVLYTRVFRELFKLDEMKQWVFITKKNNIWDFGYDSAGFCYSASVAFAIKLGIKDWQLMCIDGDKYAGRMDHHYLLHKPSGNFFDITYDQFAIDGIVVPYELGTVAQYSLSTKDTPYRFAKAAGILR